MHVLFGEKYEGMQSIKCFEDDKFMTFLRHTAEKRVFKNLFQIWMLLHLLEMFLRASEWFYQLLGGGNSLTLT